MISNLFFTTLLCACTLNCVPKHNLPKRANENAVNEIYNNINYKGGFTYQFNLNNLALDFMNNKQYLYNNDYLITFGFRQPNSNCYVIVDNLPSQTYDFTDSFTFMLLTNTITFSTDNGDYDLIEFNNDFTSYTLYLDTLTFSVSCPQSYFNQYGAFHVIENNCNLSPYNWLYHNKLVNYVTPNSLYSYLSFESLASYDSLMVGESIVLNGIFSRADSDSHQYYYAMKNNTNYKQLSMTKLSTSRVSFSVLGVDSNDDYTQSYESGYFVNMLQLKVISPIYYVVNQYGVPYGVNYNTSIEFIAYNSPTNEFNMNDLVFTLIDTPIYTLFSLFNIELLGVNMFGLVTGLLSALLIVWVVRKFI